MLRHACLRLMEEVLMNQNTRNFGFYVIRIVACLAIVVLHTAQYGTDAFKNPEQVRIAAMSLRNCMMWAVPCFVMVTGALLLDPARELSLKKLFTKYIARIFWALLLISAVYEITDYFIFHERTLPEAVKNWAEGILYASGWKPLWYLYLLIGLYLLMPFYKKIAAHCSRQEMRYLLIVLFVFQALIPTIEALSGKDIGFYIAVYSVYMLYLFMGYAISQGMEKLPKKMILPLLIVSFAAVVLFTYLYITGQRSGLNAAVTRYSFVLTVFQAGWIYILLHDLKEPVSSRITALIRKLDSLTFGVYLIHLIFLRVLIHGRHFNMNAHGGIAMILLCALVIFILSAMVTWLCKTLFRHIPVLRIIF